MLLNKISHINPKVFVLIPYKFHNDALFDDSYDNEEFRNDLESWFSELKLEWQWIKVCHNGPTEYSIDSVLRKISEISLNRAVIAFNFCDGTEELGDKYPGRSIVKALEKAEIPFTGANCSFYDISTVKTVMKKAMVSAGIPTPPYIKIENIEEDCRRAEKLLQFPLIIKPDVSAASFGISQKARVTDLDSLRKQAQWLHNGGHDPEFFVHGVFAESFIDGPEYTVLVVDDPLCKNGVRIFPPLERRYHPLLPFEKRFLSYDIYNTYSPDTILPDLPGGPFFRYTQVDSPMKESVEQLAYDAYNALNGNGYARVDIRIDRHSGNAFVLEVNANCGIGSACDCSAGTICRIYDIPFKELIGTIIYAGLMRK
jgi:D-alanine-D-alanine ligase-like ATP-grasp enzyme